MTTMNTSTICITTLIALIGTCPCQADDPIYATIEGCVGSATLDLTASGASGEVSDSDEDTISSFEELPLSVDAAVKTSMARIECDIAIGGTITGDNTFRLSNFLDSFCAVGCYGCWVDGNADVFIDIDLMVYRPTKLILVTSAFWEFTLGTSLTLARPGEDPRMLHEIDGWVMEEDELATFEIQPGAHVLRSSIPFNGCGPYKGNTQYGGGWLDLAFTFVASDLPADLNLDGLVDGVDLAILLGNWGEGYVPGDINGDGDVGGSDLAEVLGSWS